MTTPPKPRRKATAAAPPAGISREELDALYQQVARATQIADEARAQQLEIGPLIRDMHSKLMEPQPGHDKALLDRIAAVTISVESGDRVGRFLVRGAQILAAIGVLFGTGWLASKAGTAPK